VGGEGEGEEVWMVEGLVRIRKQTGQKFGGMRHSGRKRDEKEEGRHPPVSL
jgi:hypothetical protein